MFLGITGLTGDGDVVQGMITLGNDRGDMVNGQFVGGKLLATVATPEAVCLFDFPNLGGTQIIDSGTSQVSMTTSRDGLVNLRMSRFIGFAFFLMCGTVGSFVRFAFVTTGCIVGNIIGFAFWALCRRLHSFRMFRTIGGTIFTIFARLTPYNTGSLYFFWMVCAPSSPSGTGFFRIGGAFGCITRTSFLRIGSAPCSLLCAKLLRVRCTACGLLSGLLSLVPGTRGCLLCLDFVEICQTSCTRCSTAFCPVGQTGRCNFFAIFDLVGFRVGFSGFGIFMWH